MSSNNGATYLSNQRVVPNVSLRLLQRELGYHYSGAGVHTSRSFSECIVPTHKVLHTEAPSYHIGKFTADGSWLVCFSLQLESVVLLEYLGPAPQAAAGAAGNYQQQPIAFHSFFKERWRLPLCSDTEQLCRDFCVSLQHGRFLLLASCTPQQARPGTTAAAAAGGAAAGGPAQQAGRQQQQQQLAPDAGTAGEAGGMLAQGQRAPSSDCCAVTTFHVVDLRRCVKVDQRQFHNDHFDLSGNACVSLYDNILALTSIRQQTIHLLQVHRDGTLTDIQHIGLQCQADDSVPIELAAAAEHQWQLQKQHDRQQQQYWMHQQARALLPPKHCPPKAACQCSSGRSALQQQQQQQARPPAAPAHPQQHGARGTGVHSPPAAAAATAAATAGSGRVSGHVRRRDTEDDSGSSSSSEDEGASEAAEGTDSDDSMDEDRRRRVRRRLSPTVAAPAAAGVGLGAAGAREQVHPPQQQQQQQGRVPAGQTGPRQQQLQGRALTGRELAAATGDGGAAAATAATAAALLDPGGQLITGLRQRLLAFLYKTAGSQRRCDVAPSKRDFYHNFGVLSNLVTWRARLLGQDQLLLKLGAPTSGAATVADANPNGIHFFGVYDMRTTRFTGFYEAGSPQLLTEVLEHPCRLLVASGDLSPAERCCAAALYPAGFPVGMDHQQHQQQQQPGTAAAGSSGVGQQGPATAAAAAAASSSRMLGPPLPSAAAAAAAAAMAGAAAHQSLQQPPAAVAGPSLQRADAAAEVGPAQRLSSDGSRQQRPGGGSASARVSDGSGGSSSGSKAARERLKFLRRVVLMVLPGLQNLSPSPYLDPHLFRYSKHLSPIIGLRNSPAHPVRFQLARQYPGFSPTVHQQLVTADGSADGTHVLAARDLPAGAAAAAAGSQGTQTGPQQQQQQQEQHEGDVLQLDVVLPPTVVHGGEEVARRQLHLLHPTDPFVLVVVQTPGQPAQLDIYFRM